MSEDRAPTAAFVRNAAGSLACESTELRALAERHGTPLYVYSAASFRSRYRRLAAACREHLAGLEPIVAYSVKACSSLGILRRLAVEGCGFDVVSGGELLRVARAGGDLGKTILAGVGKTDAELELALEARVFQINVESAGELARLDAVARRRGVRARAALRVNPAIDPKTHPHLATSAPTSKFGLELDEARAALAAPERFPQVELVGLHLHLGSMLRDAHLWEEAFEKIAPLLALFPGGRPKTLDVGGGIAIGVGSDPELAPEKWLSRIAPLLRRVGARPILEPGRWIAAPSGALLTRVLDVKNAGGRRIVVVDAAMNDLIRPALYGAVHPIEQAARVERAPRAVDVVGPVCESGDFLGKNITLPDPQPGDLLAILDAGAYGFSMASTYNSRPRAAEVLVEEGGDVLLRRRETFDDVVRGELL